MATYPASVTSIAANKQDDVDTVTGVDAGTTTNVGDHAGHHNTLAAEVNAITLELGTNPRGSYADVKARLDAVSQPEPVNTVSASGTAQTIPDPTVQPMNRVTLTGNCTFTFPTVVAGKSFSLALKQDATGSRTVTWPAAVRWPGSTAPVLTTTANRTDVISFVSFDGATWYGFVGGLNFAV